VQLKIDMQILALEPQPNGLTLIEARAPDGTGLLVTARVAEPLAVGGWMTMALLAEPAAVQPAAPAQSMRARMQAGPRGMAAPQAPRSAATAGSDAPASAAGDASSLLLSSILGNPAGTGKTANLSDLFDNSPLVERNVDDEMDALFGAPPRKG
jgi:hypothetical protein